MRLLDPPYSPFDLAVVVLVSFHLIFSLAAAAFVLFFHFRSCSSSSSTPSCSFGRRLRHLLHLNSLWPVRLLLLLFATLLSLSELLRLPRHHPVLCKLYAVASQSFAEPAFFATLIFLLRASTEPKNYSSFSLAAAFANATFATIPFLTLHVLDLTLFPWAFPRFSLLVDSLPAQFPADRCTHQLFGTVLLACLCVIYVPLFVSVCWGVSTLVINKRLRIRLYMLTIVVVAALSMQVSAISLSSLWSPSCDTSKGLDLAAFVAVLAGVAVGEGILVVKPVLDALDIAAPEEHGMLDTSNGRNGDVELS